MPFGDVFSYIGSPLSHLLTQIMRELKCADHVSYIAYTSSSVRSKDGNG
jgi:hypothetical protein